MADLITDARLKTFLPGLADLDVWAAVLNEAMTRFDIVTPERAALSAARFWKSHGLNELADNTNDDDDEEDFVTISVKINGGRAGLDSRIRDWANAKALCA